MFIGGLKTYTNIPLINTDYKDLSSMTAISMAINSKKVDNNYFNNTSNYSEKIYSLSNAKKDSVKLFNNGKDLISALDSSTSRVGTKESSIDKKVTATTVTDDKTVLSKSYKVSIQNIATSQNNKGNSLNASQSSSYSKGQNTFTINYKGQSKDVSFKVEEGETNEKSLNNMSNAINDANLGVKASVVKDDKTNSVYLNIESKDTGKSNAFQITEKSGNAVAVSNANNKVKDAVDSNYMVDGKKYSSESNKIDIDNGKVNLNLKEATDTVKVSVKADKKILGDKVEKFIGNYNKFLEDVKKNDPDLSSIKSSQDAIKRNEKRLSNIGITVNEDNTLSVDREKLNKALDIEPEKVKDAFTSYTGIGKNITNTARAISQDPIAILNLQPPNSVNNVYALMQQNVAQGSILNLYK